MDLLWMILPVFLGCAEAENPTQVKAELGQNVTLNCSLNISNIFWFMEIHSQFIGCIVRTFSTNPTDNKYFVYPVMTKYIAMGNRLVITNITAEDFRLYFCSKTPDNNKFKDGIRLVSDVPIPPSTNDSKANHPDILSAPLVTYGSLALNVLLLVVIGFVFTSPCLKRKDCSSQVNEPSPFTCENPETLETVQHSCCVYKEIQLPTFRAPPASCLSPELPRSTLPRQRHLRHLDGY
ncbi:uncharacterized protein LOC122871978 isoform X1 [Siniperca chuatsi]|uniref:uncharacterized protein LOC122871978 isoform X1 n=1 Tax=Siniperca chuatsi TaxID=119488 RepID=UPI001CE12967|nr:uncharacterized protein LOC122871978 isoform X1 [Siniperca chuatsi]